MNRIRAAVIFMVLAAAAPELAGSVLPSPLGPGPIGTPNLGGKVALEQRLGEPVPADLRLTDESGGQVRLGDVAPGRPQVIALVQYRCPMLCGEVLNGLIDSLKQVPFAAGKQFDVVVVSIDPRETAVQAAEVRRRCLARYDRPGTDAGWHFLTAGKDAIDELAAAVGYRYVYDADRDQFAHPAGVVLVTPERRISHYFFGVAFPPRDLRLGLVEASRNGIGSLADQVLLLCYHYDPETGKYGPAVMAMVRFGGVLTLAALAGFMLVAARRPRRTDG